MERYLACVKKKTAAIRHRNSTLHPKSGQPEPSRFRPRVEKVALRLLRDTRLATTSEPRQQQARTTSADFISNSRCPAPDVIDAEGGGRWCEERFGDWEGVERGTRSTAPRGPWKGRPAAAPLRGPGEKGPGCFPHLNSSRKGTEQPASKRGAHYKVDERCCRGRSLAVPRSVG